MQVLRCAVVFLFMSRISESFRSKHIFVRIWCEYPHPRFVLFFVGNFLLLCCGIFLRYRSLLIAFFVFSVGCVLCSRYLYEFPFRMSTLCCVPYVFLGRMRAPVCRVLFLGGGRGGTQLHGVPSVLLTVTSWEYYKSATAWKVDFIYCLFQTIITVRDIIN